MKHTILFLFSILVIAAVGCHANEKQINNTELTKHYTFDQVKSVAAKYGLEEWVKEETHNGLMYQNEADLEQYFKYHKEVFDKQKEERLMDERLKQSGGMSYDAYLSLVDQLPALRRAYVRAYDRTDNEAYYQEQIKQMRDSGVNFVYVDDQGVINFSTCGKPNCN